MLKREIKRFKNRFSSLSDPLGIVALILLFLLPTLAVLNLSPQYKSREDNVLGVIDGEDVGLVMVGGVHDIIKEEYMDFKNEKLVEYSSKIIKAKSSRYSKPIIQITNPKSEKSDIRVSALTQLASSQKISVVLDGFEYILQDTDGTSTPQTISLSPSSKSDIYLVVTNTQDILFNNSVYLTLVLPK